MRARGAIGLAWLGATTACLEPPGGDFDLDVVARANAVTVQFRSSDPPCTPAVEFPHPGECKSWTDYATCEGDSESTCLARVTVERDGVELASTMWLWDWWRGVALSVPGVLDAPNAQLVIDGCGGNARIDLPDAPAPIPQITDVTTGPEQITVSWWTDEPHSGGYASTGYGFSGDMCHVAGAVPIDLPAHPGATGSLHVGAVVEEPAQPTPWGRARIWNIGFADLLEVSVPL